MAISYQSYPCLPEDDTAPSEISRCKKTHHLGIDGYIENMTFQIDLFWGIGRFNE